MIQCRVKEEVKVRKQETVEEGIQCFRCWGVGHYKWEYSNIKVEKERRRSEEVVHVVNLQKAQQEERLVRSLWRKVQEYYGKRDMPPRGAALEEQGWKTRWEVVTFVECKNLDCDALKLLLV